MLCLFLMRQYARENPQPSKKVIRLLQNYHFDLLRAISHSLVSSVQRTALNYL